MQLIFKKKKNKPSLQRNNVTQDGSGKGEGKNPIFIVSHKFDEIVFVLGLLNISETMMNLRSYKQPLELSTNPFFPRNVLSLLNQEIAFF